MKAYNLKKIKINNEKCVCIGINWNQMTITSKEIYEMQKFKYYLYMINKSPYFSNIKIHEWKRIIKKS